MELDMKTALTELSGKLDKLFAHIENIENDVKDLAKKVESLTLQLSNQSREIGGLQKDIEYAEKSRLELRNEIAGIWSHFQKVDDSCRLKHMEVQNNLLKEKEDLKGYVKTITEQSVNSGFLKTKVWVYGSAFGVFGLIILQIVNKILSSPIVVK